MSYAYQYISVTENAADIKDITLSFVCLNKPAAVFERLSETYEIKEAYAGIYRLKGSALPFPIQFIISGELDEDENLFLNALRRDIDKRLMLRIITEEKRHNKRVYRNFISAVTNANPNLFMEVIDMDPEIRALYTDDELKEIEQQAYRFFKRRGFDLEAERREKEAALEEKRRANEEVRMLREKLRQYEQAAGLA